MTLEERVDNLFKGAQKKKSDSWDHWDSCVLPNDFDKRIVAVIRAAVDDERERIAKLAEELNATYTVTGTGWGLGGQNSTICSKHCFAGRIRDEKGGER